MPFFTPQRFDPTSSTGNLSAHAANTTGGMKWSSAEERDDREEWGLNRGLGTGCYRPRWDGGPRIREDETIAYDRAAGYDRYWDGCYDFRDRDGRYNDRARDQEYGYGDGDYEYDRRLDYGYREPYGRYRETDAWERRGGEYAGYGSCGQWEAQTGQEEPQGYYRPEQDRDARSYHGQDRYGQSYYAQSYYGQEQAEYAPAYSMGYVRQGSRLTQAHPAASNASLNANAPSFAPINPSPAQSVSRWQPNKGYRIDKSTRYQQQTNQVLSRNGFNAALFNTTFATPTELPPPKPKYQLPRRSARIADKKPQHYGSPALNASFRSASPPPLPRPAPTKNYIDRAHRPPTTLPTPRSLLIILDLNGTLLHRHRGSKTYIPRPGLQPFLTYLLSTHSVMIWSSARSENVQRLCHDIFTPAQYAQLAAVWGRETLRLSDRQFGGKVQVYKQLSWIWESKWAKEAGWGQGNTVLIDDSREKAAAEPWNLVQVEEFLGGRKKGKDEEVEDVLGAVKGYLEELRWQGDVSAYMRVKPFRSGGGEDAVR